MSAPAYYSPSKIGWHTTQVAQMQRGERVTPVSMQLLLSDLCNQDCEWCAYRASAGLSKDLFAGPDGEKNPKRMIPTWKAEEIIDDAISIGYRSIIFTGGGEPTVHPAHIQLMTRSLKGGLSISLNSNGVLLRQGWRDTYPRMAYIRFSVDAGSAKAYSETRGVGLTAYDLVLENITRVVEVCEEEESECVLGAGFVVSPVTVLDLDVGIQRLLDCGLEYVRLASVQATTSAYTAEEWVLCMNACRGVAIKYGEKVVNLFESAQGERPRYQPCRFQEVVTYVGADLTIYRCCYTAYTENGVTASLKDQRLMDWYNDPETRADFQAFDARSCNVCPLNAKNETMNYLAGKPAHVEFL